MALYDYINHSLEIIRIRVVEEIGTYTFEFLDLECYLCIGSIVVNTGKNFVLLSLACSWKKALHKYYYLLVFDFNVIQVSVG